MQKVHFRLTFVAQKRCCLSSLVLVGRTPQISWIHLLGLWREVQLGTTKQIYTFLPQRVTKKAKNTVKTLWNWSLSIQLVNNVQENWNGGSQWRQKLEEPRFPCPADGIKLPYVRLRILSQAPPAHASRLGVAGWKCKWDTSVRGEKVIKE